MTSDIDIYRSAHELIKQHGDAADIEAAMRADQCLAAGDMEGRAVWLVHRLRRMVQAGARRRAALRGSWVNHLSASVH